MTESKAKKPPKDYDADLRFDPPPEEATEKELHKRVHRFVKKSLFGNDAPPMEPSKTK